MAAKRKFGIAKSKRQIFVVGDETDFCEGLVRLINAQTDLITCGKVADVGKAFKAVSDLRPDLAVIDLGLPVKRGFDLIKKVRSLKLAVKLLVISSHDEAIYSLQALRAGGDGYLRRPEDPPEILNAIRDVLNGRIYVSEEVFARSSIQPSSGAKPRLIDKLTELELEVLESLGEGRSNDELAQRFRMKAGELADLCSQIQRKLELGSLNALIRYAVCRVEHITT